MAPWGLVGVRCAGICGVLRAHHPIRPMALPHGAMVRARVLWHIIVISQGSRRIGATPPRMQRRPRPLPRSAGPGKVIALYFSAHWCPPCRQFTPHLASIYTNFKKDHALKADWEVVFVSSDRDEESFKEYFGEMPWAALPYDKREAKAALSQLYKVCGLRPAGTCI